MNLDKVEHFIRQIESLKEEINSIEMRINVIHNIGSIVFKGGKGASYNYFDIHENSFTKLDKPLEVFKTLALNELNDELKLRENKLDELIKKGITDND